MKHIFEWEKKWCECREMFVQGRCKYRTITGKGRRAFTERVFLGVEDCSIKNECKIFECVFNPNEPAEGKKKEKNCMK